MGALMLAMQIARVGVDNIGPVTMGLIGAQALLFFYELDLPFSTADAAICIGASQVWYGRELKRYNKYVFLFLS